MLPASRRLHLALADLASLARLSTADWNVVVPLARGAGLLGRLAVLLEEAELLESVPDGPRQHLIAARILVDKHARDVRWEVRSIARALGAAGERFVLLKGAAYLIADLPSARGRLFGDVDILVPADRIPAVESALQSAGWVFQAIDAYDERYYRAYTHELPPMIHAQRGTVLDVHHTIVPRTARIALDAGKLWASAREVATGIAVLSPADMVLHSATHLFNEGEFGRALRDLDDITRLLRHFNADPEFATALRARARELDLTRPLYYALRWSRRILGGPLSERDLDGLAGLPPLPMRVVMDLLLEQVLFASHPDDRTIRSALAAWLLYVRAHHLRMPAHLLVPHLLRKSWMQMFDRDNASRLLEPQPPP